MDLCQLFFFFLLLLCVAILFAICFIDGDLSLIFCDKYGKQLKDLKGRVVWITGASTGIGAAIAVEAVKHGAKVAISARSKDKLEDVKEKCLEDGYRYGTLEEDVLVVPMDMCDFHSHKECLDKVLNHFGKLDIMVHNAGRSQRARWEHIDIKVDREMFDLNVFSIINLTRLVIPHFLEQGEGTFAVMSSLAGKFGLPFSGTYTGSKHVLHGYFESLRNEKLGSGINITLLCPGPVFSNLMAIAATEKPDQLLEGEMSPTSRRMNTQRCAHLCLVAAAHRLEEAWIAFFPVLPLMYCSQYMPTLCKRVTALMGQKYLQLLRDGKETVKY